MTAAIKKWLGKHEKKVLFWAILFTAAIYSAIGFWKYAHFRYNAVDLAYFNQVFWNSLHGHFFAQSIHPHLSLGDHAELVIPALLPFYSLWPDPRALIILQAAMLALCAWPLWRVARRHCGSPSTGSGNKPSTVPALLIAFSWLASPLIGNIALFEFHILPFALLPLFFAADAYELGRKRQFLLFIATALLVREDVALVAVMFGLLAWFEKKSWWWRITPAAVSACWFLAVTRLTAHFAPAGSYKFLIYYEWLGATPLAIIKAMFLHPLRILAHVTTLPNLEMLLGFLMATALLPLFAPRRTLLAILPLLQIVLGGPGGGELILDTHYSSLFLPGLYLAMIDGFAAAPHAIASVWKLQSRFGRELAALLLGVSVVFSAAVFGPLPGVKEIISRKPDPRADDAANVVDAVPENASIAASYALLPQLSSRERLYSLHYIFLGVTQFAESPYPPPPDITDAALDLQDLSIYDQFRRTAWTAPHYDGGMERLRQVLGGEKLTAGDFVLFSKTRGSTPALDSFVSANADAIASDKSISVLDDLRTVTRYVPH